MSNIYYSVLTSENGLQLYPSDASIKLLKTKDEMIDNNFQFLYTQLEAQKRSIQFLDLINIIGNIKDKDTWTAQVNSLLPGEALCYQDTRELIVNGETYQYGDYVLRLPNQTLQKIGGQAPLGYLPILSNENNKLTLYFYEQSGLDDTYKKVKIDYTGGSPVYTGYDDSGSASLRLDSEGVFHDGSGAVSPENAIGLVGQYEYNYTISEPTNPLMISAQLTNANNYTKSISGINSYYGIVKLYAQQSDGSIEEYHNGLNIQVDTANHQIAYTLKTALQSLNVSAWWLEVK